MRLVFNRNPENARAQKILAAAAFIGIPLDVRYCETNKPSTSQDYNNIADPCGQYPILEIDEVGVNLFEANAILRYVARCDKNDEHHVFGRTPFEASQVDMWVDFAANEIDRANAVYIRATFEEGADVPTDEDQQAVERVLAGLEEVLSIRTFLVGERMSIADIAVAFSLQWVYRCNRKNGEAMTKKYRAVYRHYNTVMRHPKIKEVMKKENATLGPYRA